MKPSQTTLALWKKLGLTFANWADSTFLYGVGRLGFDVYHVILSAIGQKYPPLNWNYPFQMLYTNQQSVLWVADPDGQRSFLPQVVIIGPLEKTDESSIGVELSPSDFHAPIPVSVGLEFYRRNSDGSTKKIFFDGENARLLDWDVNSRKLIFQSCSYYDYLQTNLALDVPLSVMGTLREQLVEAGQIEPLRSSKLANHTGINGLLFSNDGYMIIQKRREKVLVRPGELCSGFSGTINKMDIVHTVRYGGRLEHLDVLREMVEEVGIRYSEVITRNFLGLTRELIRGGKPEMFYSVNVDLSVNSILSRLTKDKEGDVESVFFGPYASTTLEATEAAKLPHHFWALVEAIQAAGKGPISVPLLTNLALWYQSACPTQVGTDALPNVSNAAKPQLIK